MINRFGMLAIQLAYISINKQYVALFIPKLFFSIFFLDHKDHEQEKNYLQRVK